MNEKMLDNPVESWGDNRTLGFFDKEELGAMSKERMREFIIELRGVDEAAFPESMQYSLDEYQEMLGLSSAIVTTLSEGSEVIGYSLSYSIDDGIDDLLEHGDKNIEQYRDQPKTVYSETFAIKPEYQNSGSLKSFYIELVEALRYAGYTKLLLHARRSTMSPILQGVFGYTPKSTFPNWLDGEDSDFYEIDLV